MYRLEIRQVPKDHGRPYKCAPDPTPDIYIINFKFLSFPKEWQVHFLFKTLFWIIIQCMWMYHSFFDTNICNVSNPIHLLQINFNLKSNLPILTFRITGIIFFQFTCFPLSSFLIFEFDD